MSPVHKIQRTGNGNGSEFKKRAWKASSFRFENGPSSVVNDSTLPNSAFQLVDLQVFVEPPPGYESFKNTQNPPEE